jgi:hypothetical protein
MSINKPLIMAEVNSYRKELKIINQYGFFRIELILLMELNDKWLFTFEEFSDIVAHAPKTYSSNLTRQRLFDSLEWLNYIETFRKPSQRPHIYCEAHTWKEFMRMKKSVIHGKNLLFPKNLKLKIN